MLGSLTPRWGARWPSSRSHSWAWALGGLWVAAVLVGTAVLTQRRESSSGHVG
jgi:hypothetical protein